MILWDDFQSLDEVSYAPDWTQLGARPDSTDPVSALFDTTADVINGFGSVLFKSVEASRRQMLAESPDLAMRDRDDGYSLEAEKLLAIQQKSSRGYTVTDINPGLLNRLEFPLSIPYEFIFDGTNFIPDGQGSVSENFRTINIPVPGNFLKVEFIQETNTRANMPEYALAPSGLRPYAQRKYQDIAPDEANLTTGRTLYSFDNYARNKVFVNFSDAIEKPLIVTRSGDSFNTYFNEVNITVSVGAPKLRITVGMNSERQDGPSVAAINSRMSMTGSARLFADSDTVLSPFSICESDNGYTSFSKFGIGMSSGVNSMSQNLIQNLNSVITNGVDTLGYTVVFITRIAFNAFTESVAGANSGYFRASFLLTNVGATEVKRVHTFNVNSFSRAGEGMVSQYVAEFPEPIRVVIPSKCALTLALDRGLLSAAQCRLNYTIDGYSLGELLRVPVGDTPGLGFIQTSKFVTDSTFLSDYNRIFSIARY